MSSAPESPDAQLSLFLTALMEDKKPNFTQWQLYLFERILPYPSNQMFRALRRRLESDYKIESIDPIRFGDHPLLNRVQTEQAVKAGLARLSAESGQGPDSVSAMLQGTTVPPVEPSSISEES